MTAESPSSDLLSVQRGLARVPPHCGTATFHQGDATLSGSAEFLLPASGQAIVAFQAATGEVSSRDFARDLVIEGICDHGSFRIQCPQIYARRPSDAYGGWSLISPVNGPALIRYGAPRRAASATVFLNNFDYGCGDAVETPHGGMTHIGTPLKLDAGGRPVTFRHHPDRPRLLPLVQAGVLRSASLVGIAFDVNPDESDEALLNFTVNVAGLCTFAAGAGVSAAMLDLFDSEGTLIRRVIPQPVTSRYHDNEIVEDLSLARLFSEAFGEYVEMKQAHAPWIKLASYCASLEDPPFLEQKFASLSMAIEYFIRNSLMERGRPDKEVTGLDFPALIGAARKHLGWDVPKHYMARHTSRLLRNAVMHGGELPTKDSAEFRLLLDKWRLFLFRRVLIRLGYKGKVVSPHRGWASTSDVADFSEEHNSFTPADPNTPDPWAQMIKKFREQRASTADQQP